MIIESGPVENRNGWLKRAWTLTNHNADLQCISRSLCSLVQLAVDIKRLLTTFIALT